MTESEPPVFDVKIVDPADLVSPPDREAHERVPEKKAVEKAPVPKRKPVIVKRRKPVDLDNRVKPDVVFGEGLGEAHGNKGDSETRGDRGRPEERESAEKEAGPPASDSRDMETARGPAVSPDELFDRTTIEKYARKGTPGTDIHDDKGAMFYAPEFKNRAYMRMLRDRIESIWKYPEEAARRRLTGDLYIKFTIRKNGRLESVELVRTSGYRDLDEAAIQALKKADPYWPLPDNYEKDVLEITGHFIYVLGGSYLM